MVLVNKTLFVDLVNGNGGTRERLDLPYATIAAAKSAALRGDTILLRPGTYTAGDLVKSFAVAVTSASRSSNTVTINATSHGFSANDLVRIAGPPSTIQGEWVVESASTNSFTFKQVADDEASIDINGPANNQTTYAVGKLTYLCDPGVTFKPSATMFSYSSAAPFWVEFLGRPNVVIAAGSVALADVTQNASKLVLELATVVQESANSTTLVNFAANDFAGQNLEIDVDFDELVATGIAFSLVGAGGFIRGDSIQSDARALNITSQKNATLEIQVARMTGGTEAFYFDDGNESGGRIAVFFDRIAGVNSGIAIVNSNPSPATVVRLDGNEVIASDGAAVYVEPNLDVLIRNATLRSTWDDADGVAVDLSVSGTGGLKLHDAVLVSHATASVSIKGPSSGTRSVRLYGTVMANKAKASSVTLLANSSGLVVSTDVV